MKRETGEFPAGTRTEISGMYWQHLHQWHVMMMEVRYDCGMKGEKPGNIPQRDIPWKTTPKLNRKNSR
ncbi:MAG: hypothetical protein IPJ13_32555 [Saprospiraceae bacterium]|nr:hypothetical protein [Saprospiraceae bacterium]